MNRFQKVVAIVAAVNVMLMLLFPPFLNSPVGRWTPSSFEGFYFRFMAPPGRVVHTDLLAIELAFILINALAAWLALRPRAGGHRPPVMADVGGALLLFGIVNFAVVFLFPPFEPYSSLAKSPQSTFDGFYFLFGDKMQRDIFAPMLYLECIVIASNLLVAGLMFSIARREITPVDEELMNLAHKLPPEQERDLVEALRQGIESSDRER